MSHTVFEIVTERISGPANALTEKWTSRVFKINLTGAEAVQTVIEQSRRNTILTLFGDRNLRRTCFDIDFRAYQRYFIDDIPAEEITRALRKKNTIVSHFE